MAANSKFWVVLQMQVYVLPAWLAGCTLLVVQSLLWQETTSHAVSRLFVLRAVLFYVRISGRTANLVGGLCILLQATSACCKV